MDRTAPATSGGVHDPDQPAASEERARLRRQAVSIALAVSPFGVAFGALAVSAGLSVWQAVGFSALVFTGSAQFAAVSVLAYGGAAIAAVSAGLLLNARSLAFGVVMAPDLDGPLWRRALESQLMIDEAMAVGSAGTTSRMRRLGYLLGGGGVYLTWNLATLLGAVAVPGDGTLVHDLGIDATIPAAFLALLWPRLSDPHQRRVALVGVAVTLVAVPLTPPGVPILIAGFAALLPGPDRQPTPRWRGREGR